MPHKVWRRKICLRRAISPAKCEEKNIWRHFLIPPFKILDLFLIFSLDLYQEMSAAQIISSDLHTRLVTLSLENHWLGVTMSQAFIQLRRAYNLLSLFRGNELKTKYFCSQNFSQLNRHLFLISISNLLKLFSLIQDQNHRINNKQ